MVVQLNVPVASLVFHFLDRLNFLAECIGTELLGLQMVVQLLFSHLFLVLAEQMFVIFAAFEPLRRSFSPWLLRHLDRHIKG